MPILNSMPIYIGTSGYKYDDWIGTFYPENTAHYKMLEFYCRKFNFVEITFTFYKIPYKKTIESILSRAGKNVYFSVRIHKNFLRGRYNAGDINEFMHGISPLLENNMVKAFFADYNYKFSSSKENFKIISKIKSEFTDSVPFFVELPSSTWYKERYIEEFKEKNIGLICLSMPNIKGLAPFYPVSTNHYTYFRLYGKSRLWIMPEEKNLEYSYSTSQIEKILKSCLDASILSKEAFISFCNVSNGNAACNAETANNITERTNGKIS